MPSLSKIVAVGMFDGVHAGHRFVIDELKRLGVRYDMQPVVVTFDVHPKSVICPGKAPGLLTDTECRVRLLRDAGIDEVVVLPFTEELRNMTARDFAQTYLRDRLGAKGVLIGYDNGFGSDRLRGAEAYRTELTPLGLNVFQCARHDDSNSPDTAVSSSAVRRALAQGDITAVNRMLGRPFSLSGKVVHGKQLGRTIGFPTANVEVSPDMALPACGVYAAFAYVDSRKWPAMVNVGNNPTVNPHGAPVTVEAHIITPEGEEVPDLYGHIVTLEFMARLRGEQRFASLADLQAALHSDRTATLHLLHDPE